MTAGPGCGARLHVAAGDCPAGWPATACTAAWVKNEIPATGSPARVTAGTGHRQRKCRSARWPIPVKIPTQYAELLLQLTRSGQLTATPSGRDGRQPRGMLAVNRERFAVFLASVKAGQLDLA
jgi:hypothetical protein